MFGIPNYNVTLETIMRWLMPNCFMLKSLPSFDPDWRARHGIATIMRRPFNPHDHHILSQSIQVPPTVPYRSFLPEIWFINRKYILREQS
jgi:hypothetical protein